MLERHFEDEKKLTALEKELCGERNQKQKVEQLPFFEQSSWKVYQDLQQPFNISADIKAAKSGTLLAYKETNNNNKAIVKKVQFAVSEENGSVILLLLYRKEPATWKLKSVSNLLL